MDVSKILVWNVRGLNQRARRDSVREEVNSTRPDIICLQETKLEHVTLRHTLSALGSDYDKFISLPANGTCGGGVLIAWKSTVCQCISTRIDTFTASVQFVAEDGPSWWFMGVYGP
uniref:Endonuclease/exonuclease/phosphatase domain-containing protein n=1 Tax=Arundo donax TaxID=35708 RepID=A0A0A9BGB3_ARUDO